MYRVPGKLSEIGQPIQKPAVLMMHGLFCDMNFWIANDADLAPPFILVNEGYDVWLGNNRGTRFAQAHVSLSKSQQEFWETNYIDMGTKETPDFIDFILNKTG